MKKLFFIIVLNTLFFEAKARDINFERDNMVWFQYNNQIKLSKNLTYISDANIGWFNSFNILDITLFRTGFSYKLNPNLSFGAGIGWAGFYSKNKLKKSEIRPHQNIIWTNKIGKVLFFQRFQLDIRYRYLTNTDPRKGYLNYRPRYFFFFRFPLFDLEQSSTNRVALTLGNETFLAFGTKTNFGGNYLEQTQFTGGPTVFFNNQLIINVHYQKRIRSTSNRSIMLNYDGIFIGLIHKIGFKN